MRAAAVHEALARSNFERDVAFLTPLFLKSRNWSINELQFPTLDVTFLGTKPLRMRLDCTDWDELPPDERILAADGSSWPGPTTNPSIFNGGPHSVRGGPFVCTAGFRGYHTHSGHTTDAWSNYRGQDGNNLVGLLDQLSRAWRKIMGA
jgi:hypothetical protein